MQDKIIQYLLQLAVIVAIVICFLFIGSMLAIIVNGIGLILSDISRVYD